MNVAAKFEKYVAELMAIEVLGGGCEPPILEKRRRQGLGMVPFENALMSSYRPFTRTLQHRY